LKIAAAAAAAAAAAEAVANVNVDPRTFVPPPKNTVAYACPPDVTVTYPQALIVT